MCDFVTIIVFLQANFKFDSHKQIKYYETYYRERLSENVEMGC